jgi:Periplasmic lysozyme inhibitor of I-type lysozyme
MPDPRHALGRRALIGSLLALCSGVAAAAPPARAARVVKRLRFDERLAVVVAEGDFEPRSIGSYSVRVYRVDTAARPDDETSFFAFGAVRPRDGALERVWRAEALRIDGAPALVVTTRSAGSGDRLSADAFELTSQRIRLRASVAGLGRNVDPLPALARRLRRASAK